MPDSFQVHEIFKSIQGEGLHAGSTATFVRLQGCPVGCRWCDAKLTWYAGGERLDLGQIVARVRALGDTALLIVTGGEPLLHDLDDLFVTLWEAFPHRAIHLETSGAFPFKGFHRPDWTTLSPKAAAGWRIAPDVLLAATELKYVVDEEFEPAIVHAHQRQAAEVGRSALPVHLMPEGAPPRPEMVERALGFLFEEPAWLFGPRLQYDYPAIRAREGDTNQIISVEDARAAARAQRRRP